MIIANAEHAFVDLHKLRGYALNPMHRVGGHKAHLFASLLSMGMNDAEEFRNILRKMVRTNDADVGEYDEHGQRLCNDLARQASDNSKCMECTPQRRFSTFGNLLSAVGVNV